MLNKMRKEKNLLNKLNEAIKNKPLVYKAPELVVRLAEKPLWIHKAWNADWNTFYVSVHTVGEYENPSEVAKVCFEWAQKIAAVMESENQSDVKRFRADCVEVSFERNKTYSIARDTYIVRFSYLPA